MTYGEQMKKIIGKFEVDTSKLPDNLYSTLLEAIYNVDVSGGGGGGEGIEGITLDGSWMDIDGDVIPAMFISLHGSDNNLKLTDGVLTLDFTDTSTINDVNGNLNSANIKEGVNIFGHIGEYKGLDTSDATATSSDILTGKTAYVNGVKVTGTKEDVVQNVVWVDNVSGTLESVKDSFDNYYSMISVFIKEINIPNGITSIGNGAFYNCSNLANITIPDSVTSIGNEVFYYCESLTSITLSNTLTSIGHNTFYGCSSLTNITIPDSVTSIGNYAFYKCSKLTSINIPNGITSIGNGAFYNCSNLANIYYKGTEEQWNSIIKDTNWNKNMGSNVSGGTVIHYNS